jgi:hypothetical protein
LQIDVAGERFVQRLRGPTGPQLDDELQTQRRGDTTQRHQARRHAPSFETGDRRLRAADARCELGLRDAGGKTGKNGDRLRLDGRFAEKSAPSTPKRSLSPFFPLAAVALPPAQRG